MNPRVQYVKYKQLHKLILTFTNGEVREFDMSGYLHYPVYSKLNDLAFCSTAKVFMGTVVWDDETDFDPDILYLESVPVNEQVHP
ncbi:DUF2442 domain-containing protein [Ferruginibacter sp.]|nr:DUF2442 domain-containing protein [Ferruginibacter sp.]